MNTEKFNPLFRKFVAMLLAFTMVFTSTVVPGMAGVAWAATTEEPIAVGAYEINGTHMDFHTSITAIGNSDVRNIYSSTNRVYDGTTQVCAEYGTTSFLPSAGKTYTAKQYLIYKENTLGQFDVRVFDVLTINTTINGTTETVYEKIYRGNSYTHEVTAKDGFDTVQVTGTNISTGAGVGSYTFSNLTSDAVINVVYVADTDSTVEVGQNAGTASIFLGDTASNITTAVGTVEASTDNTVKVEPADNKYIQSVTIKDKDGNAVELKNAAYATDGSGSWSAQFTSAASKNAYTIDVVSGDVIAVEGNKISFNRNMTAAEIKAEIFKLVQNDTYITSVDDISVKFLRNKVGGDEYIDLTDENLKGDIRYYFGSNAAGSHVGSENLQITYTYKSQEGLTKYQTSTIEVAVTLEDTRLQPVINVNEGANFQATNVETINISESALLGYVFDKVTYEEDSEVKELEGATVTITSVKDADGNDVTLPITAVGKYTVTIAYAESSTYKGATAEAIFEVVDARIEAPIIIAPVDPMEVEGDSSVITNAVTNAISGVTGLQLTVALVEGEVLPEAGQTKTIKVIVTVGETAIYKETVREVEIEVTGKINPSTLNVESTGNGTTTVVGKDGPIAGTEVFDDTITVTATPGANSYVDSIKLYYADSTEAELVDQNKTYEFNDPTNRSTSIEFNTVSEKKVYKVVVVYKDRNIVLNTGELVYSINGWGTGESTRLDGTLVDQFRPEIMETLVDETKTPGYDVNNANNKLEIYNGTLESTENNGLYKVDMDGDGDYNGYTLFTSENQFGYGAYGCFGTAIYGGATSDSETFKITLPATNQYPAVTSDDITLLLKESRTAANITVGEIAEPVEFDTLDQITAAVTAAAKTDKGTLTVTATNTPATNNDGVEQDATYKLSVAESSANLGTEKDLTVKVIGKVHKATVNVADYDANHGTVTVEDGKITATPKGDYYVESVTVVDKIVDNTGAETLTTENTILTEETEGTTFSNRTFEGTFTVGNADYNVDRTYTVTVVFAERTIELLEGPYSVEYNFANAFEGDSKTNFLGQIIDATVADRNIVGQVTVDFAGSVTEPTKSADNDFILTWTSTDLDRYPTVTVPVTVFVEDGTPQAEIFYNNITDTIVVDGNFDAVIEALGATSSEGANDPTVTIEETVPLQGETKTVTVKINVEANNSFRGNEKTVEVTVKGKVHPAKVTLNQTGNGTTAVTGTTYPTVNFDENNVAYHYADTLNVLATPDAGWYVDYIKVGDTKVIDFNNDSDPLTMEALIGIVDGTNEAATADDKEYTITVVYAEKKVTLKDGTVKVNPLVDLADQLTTENGILAELDANILDTANTTLEVDGDTFADSAKYYYKAKLDVSSIPDEYKAYADKIAERIKNTYIEVGGSLEGSVHVDLGALGAYDIPVKYQSFGSSETETVKVIWEAKGKTPLVESNEVTVTIADARTELVLADKTIEVKAVDLENEALAQVLAFAKAEYVKDNAKVNPDYITVAIAEGYSLPTVEDVETEVKYTVTYENKDKELQPATATITVKMTRLSPANTIIDGSEFLNGTVTIGEGTVTSTEPYGLDSDTNITLTITPNAGYAVEDVVIEGVTGTLDIFYEDGKAFVTFKTPTDKEEGIDYVVKVTYEEAKFLFKDNATIKYLYGQDKVDNLKSDVYGTTVIAPTEGEYGTADYTVEYLARESGEYTIYVPKLAAYGVTIYEGGDYTFTLNDLWLEPGQKVEEVDLYKEIANLESQLAEVESMEDAVKLADYARKFFNELPDKHIGAHEFGALGDGSVETVRFGYADDKFVIPVDETGDTTTTTITIEDPRFETTIGVNDSEVYYGYTEEELRAKLAMTLTNDNGEALDASKIEFVNMAVGLDADEEKPYTIKVSYPGDANNQPATAVFNLTVLKAPCEIDYDSQVVTYGDDFTFELVKNPAEVDTIDFIIGLDVSQLSNDNLMPITCINLQLPGILGHLFDAETNLKDFVEKLEDLAENGGALLEGYGVSPDTITSLLNTIYSVTENTDNWGDIIVKINTDDFVPENVGVYLAGAVTADSNYQTAYTVDYLVIAPKVVEAELEYFFNDTNGIITQPVIREEANILTAYATVDGEKHQAATDAIRHLFLRADFEGNVEFVYADSNEELDLEELSKIGLYGQLSFALDWGNELYYSAPIARSYMVVNELVDVQFVDENAQPNNDRVFTYDGNGKALDVVVTDRNGEVLSNEHVTITYVGYTLNNPDEVYNSTVAPTDAGVYTAIAVYANAEREAYGADVAAMAIKPATPTVEVENQMVLAGTDYDLGITVTPEDVKYISIVAGIDTNGDIVGEGLGMLKGAINVDFPERIDNVLKELMPSAYLTGMSVNDVLTQLDKVESKLLGLGIDQEAVNAIVSVLEMVPQTEAGNVKVTFKDNVVPQNIGLYLVGAVTCDPNYEVKSDLGYLLVQPKEIEVELAFNYVDDNYIFTANYIKNSAIDMGAHVVPSDVVSVETAEDLTKNCLHNLFIGVGPDGEFVVTSQPQTEHGVYTQLAYLVDAGNEIYYADPITRSYLVVPETVKVEFVDETGAVNNDRVFTYNGQPQGMDVKVTHNDGTVLTNEFVSMRYIGYDAKGIMIYNSETAPTNVGVYTVYAVYANKEADLYGLGVGAMVIKPAEASLEVKSEIVEQSDDYRFNVIAKPESLDYISVVTGFERDGNIFIEGIGSFNNVINVDFPDAVDNYLKVVVPNAYEEGINLASLESVLDTLKDALDSVGMDSTAIDDLMAYVEGLEAPIGTIVTFAELENVKPVNVGTYQLAAISVDANYDPAFGYGIIIVTPEIINAELSFDNAFEDDGVVKTLPVGTEFDYGVTGINKETGEEIDAELITVEFVGITADGEAYRSSEAPTELGTYTQTAYIAVAANDTYLASPISRTFSIVKHATDIVFDGNTEFTYNGKAQSLVATLVDANGNALEGDLTVKYVGSRNGIEFYWSDKAPTDFGTYQMIVTYEGTDKYAPAVETETFVINKAVLEIEIDDKAKLVGDEDPELTYKILSGLVDGDEVEINLVRQPGETVGEYVINHTMTDALKNLNYDIDSHNGVLSIVKRQIVITVLDASKTYGEADGTFEYEFSGDPLMGEDTMDEILNVGPVVREEGENVGEYNMTVNPTINEGFEASYEVTVVDGTFIIVNADMTVTAEDYNKAYDGAAHSITVTAPEGATVTYATAEDGEYTLEAPTLTNVGTMTVYYKVEKANYNTVTGSATVEITKKVATVAVVDATKTYGEEDPEYDALIAGMVADEKLDITYSREAGEDVGTYVVEAIVAADSVAANYDIQLEKGELIITAKELDENAVEDITDKTFTGNAIKPVVVKDGDKTLVEGTDYDVVYENNVNVGTATATITFKGNYAGTAEASFEIVAKSIAGAEVTGISDKVYNGNLQTQDEMKVVVDGVELVKDTDYIVSYDKNLNAGTAKIVINGTGNYTGLLVETFEIQPATMDVTVNGYNGVYDGNSHGITVTGAPEGATVTYATTEDGEYTAEAPTLTNVGTITVYYKVEKANYNTITGSETVVIVKASLDPSTVTVNGYNGVYDGNAHGITVTGAPAGATVEYKVEDGEFTTTAPTFTDVVDTTVTVKITHSNYKDFVTTTSVEITEAKMDVTVNGYNGVYDSAAHGITVTGAPAGATVEYKVGDGEFTTTAPTFTDVVNTTVTVKVTADNYKAFVKTVSVKITAKELTDGAEDIADQTYIGSAIEPEVVVKDGDKTLVEGVDYDVTYSDNENAGEAKATVTLKGNYSGTIEVPFNIVAKELTDGAEDIADQTYTGSAVEPEVVVKDGDKTLVEGTDYDVTYSDNENAGEAKATVTFKGNYTGTIEVPFNIVAKELTDGAEDIADQTYTGSAVEPELVVKDGDKTLVEGVDYDVTYFDNENAGEATATITFKGNYTGTISKTFEILPANMDVTVNGYNGVYDGNAHGITVTGAPAGATVEYKVGDGEFTTTSPTFTDVVNTTVTVKVTADNYKSSVKTVSVKITAKELTDGAEDIADQTYIGSAIEPAVVVKDGDKTLVKGTDYDVTYSKNVNVGTAKVTVTFKGNYSGTATTTFKIVAKKLNSDNVGAIANQVYTSKAIKPTVVVKDGSKTLVKGTDYDVTYSKNVNAGTAKATVTFKGNYTGTGSKAFTIVAKKLTKDNVNPIANQLYTGKEIKPAVVVKDGTKTLVEGTDYTVTYKNNVKVGTATATVKFIGNYTGTATVSFKIVKTIYQHLDDLGLEHLFISEDENTGAIKAYARGFEYQSSVEDLIKELKGLDNAKLIKFTDGNGKKISSGTVSTGMEFILEINGVKHHIIIVIMGDVDGDGKIYATDYRRIQNQIMEVAPDLVDEYALAADIDDNGQIYATDYRAIQNHIMEVKTISQSNKTWEL